MQLFSLAELAMACGVMDTRHEPMVGNIRIDSRLVQPGDIFVALQGEHVDGHDFLKEVENAGAVAAIVEQNIQGCSLPQWLVPDAVIALGNIAAMNRNAFTGPVIGVTGSVGKTTVKEMIASVLAQTGLPLMTAGNLNNHLGVPLTLLRLDKAHDSAVIEMGASALGDIRYLTQLVRPNVALVTAVEAAHVEGFGSIENVAIGKAEIFEGLIEGGTAIVNLDNAYTKKWFEPLSEQFQVLSYSVSSGLDNQQADFFASEIVPGHEKWSFNLHFRNDVYPVSLSFLGDHNVANALAAAACCFAAGISLETIVTGLEAATPYKGRLQKKMGLLNSVVIDDSYNANPASVKMAINALMMFPEKKKILVLGDMAELGEAADILHGEIGAFARQAGVTRLMALGALSVHAASHFGATAECFNDHESLAKACLALADSHTVFLVKGSRSAGMDRVVDLITMPVGAEMNVSGSDVNTMMEMKG
jgi:UDP-N-acetylmuramoyl-tripeptide--D-alanyl-D-alanine ligase